MFKNLFCWLSKTPISIALAIILFCNAFYLILTRELLAQTTTLAFNHGGLNRTAQVFVPPGALPSDSLPLVLILHGFTQNGQTMLNSTGFNALAQQYRAVLAYPDRVNAGWNTQSGIPGASTADDVGYLLALADSIHARWGTRYQRLFSWTFPMVAFCTNPKSMDAGSRDSRCRGARRLAGPSTVDR